MANGTDSEEFVLLSRVRAGHKREFAFALKAQSEICGSLGRTRSKKNRNEVLATYSRKRFKRSDAKEANNDAVSVQKKANNDVVPVQKKANNYAVSVQKKARDSEDAMSEEEAKSDVVDLVSDDEPKSLAGESELVCKRVSKDDASLPVLDEELRSGVVEMAGNVLKEEEESKEDSAAVALTHESERNEDQEKRSKPGMVKTNENLVKDERNEGNSVNDDGKAGDRVVERPPRRFTRSVLKLRVEEKCAVEESNKKVSVLKPRVEEKCAVEESNKKVGADIDIDTGVRSPLVVTMPVETVKMLNYKKFPHKLKDLLETGILEGMPVKYVRGAKVLLLILLVS
jgi:hypothetical protein